MPKVRSFTTLGVICLVLGLAWPTDAQRAGRRVATLDLLAKYPLFFHGQEVILSSQAIGDSVLTYLVGDDSRLLVINVPPPLTGAGERLEVIGTFYDVGRLEPNDPRAVGQPFVRLANSLLNKPWPSTGELTLLVASSYRLATDTGGITLRTVALDPTSHLDNGVTLTGRFRGRNLYGDLPDSPGESHYDFVLTSADASVWVVGKEPKGDGFDLDVQARFDTGRWLEVTGSVRVFDGMVIIDAGAIRLAEPVEDQVAITEPNELRQGPAPDVIFSTPLEGDTDVRPDTMVRIQFSRDMDPDSFEGRVNVSVQSTSGSATPSGEMSSIEFDSEYRGLNRVLEIRFEEPLEPFREVHVQLLDGITAYDGAGLAPWFLSFYASR